MNKSICDLSFAAAFKRVLGLVLGVIFSFAATQNAWADYVGEAQTTIYLDEGTQAQIAANYQAGKAGISVGDQISYVVQFTPVPGTATEQVGAGAYVTVFIPQGTQVVGAQFVQNNGGGSYTQITPPPVAVTTANLMPEYSETGIFYSTAASTQMYTNNASLTATATNGYPGPAGGPVAGYSIHDAWDYENTKNAIWGVTANPAAGTPCTAAATFLSGPAAAPSPVAGLDTLVQVAQSGIQGPWHRIYYPGSTFGTASGVVSTAPTGGCVGGTPTSVGYVLSPSAPLTANAIRFAGGQTTVGQLFSVRITLVVTAAIPSVGLITNSEVFGGDVAVLNTGAFANKSYIWKYVYPSVANSNSTLIIIKQLTGMCVPVTPATTCTLQAYTGGAVPSVANLNLGYKVTFLNASGGPQVNVNLKDTLPTGATLVASSVSMVSGTNILPASGTTGTVSFAPLATLASGSGGTVQYTLSFATAPTVNVALPNVATLSSASIASGVISTATVTPTTLANLSITKNTTTPTVAPSGVASYSISVQNMGLAAASGITIKDTLPSDGLSNALMDRFSYAISSVTATLKSASGVVTVISPVSAVVTAPTVAPFQEVVAFTFPAAASSITTGATLTINFNANVGSNVPATSTPYLNNAMVSYNGGPASAVAITGGVAPVMVTIPLSLAKSVNCVYSGAVCVSYSYGSSIPTGSKVKYQLSYNNTSATSAVAGVVLKDALPVGVTYVASSVAETAPVPAYGIAVSSVTAATSAVGSVVTFTAISSVPANTGGTVTFDVQLAASAIPSGSSVTNTATMSSTSFAGNTQASVTTSVLNQPNLVISKTTSTPTLAVGGTASYVLTVTNTGNAAASGIQVYDALPFVSAVASTTTRFNYVATGAYIPASSSVVIASSVGATNPAPYNVNLNQQVVSWTFPASQVIAPGSSIQIPFTAIAGSGIPASSTTYYNNALVNYASGVSASVTNAAPLTIPTNLTVSKVINCVYNPAQTACNAYNGSGTIPVNATVRYHINYKNTAATAQTNVYICDQLPVQASAVPLASVITPPASAPVPAGPYTNTPAPAGPAAGALANAVAACGFTAVAGATSFNYPVIASLAAGATGDVYYDVPLTMAAGTNMTNTVTVVSTQAPSGVTATTTAVAVNVPILNITKTAAASNVSAGGTMSYTISVTNAGSAATSSVNVYDFLPYSGTVLDATKRFKYVSTTGYTLNGTAYVPGSGVVVSSSVPPTVSPYNANTNQQQVTWSFASASAVLAPGSTLAITFNVAVGSNVPATSYLNSVGYDYTSVGGSGGSNANGLASVAVTPPPLLSIAKKVAAYWDPINLFTNPLFIPGGISEYSVFLSNAGGPTDNNTIVVTDGVPANTTLFVKDIGVVGSGPVALVDGVPASGLTYTFTALGSVTDDLDFSKDNGVTWTYVPIPGGNGCDPVVNRIRINPKGILAGNAGTTTPIKLVFRVCLQ